MALRRALELQVPMLVLVVAPAREGEHPPSRFIKRGKRARELRAILAYAEQAPGAGVFVAHAGAAAGRSYPEVRTRAVSRGAPPGSPSLHANSFLKKRFVTPAKAALAPALLSVAAPGAALPPASMRSFAVMTNFSGSVQFSANC